MFRPPLLGPVRRPAATAKTRRRDSMDAYTHQYLVLGMFFVVALLFAGAPLLLARLVAPRKPSLTKQQTYECGLEAKGDPWMQLHVQYYVYALAFVAFDLEAFLLSLWAVVFHNLTVAVFIEMMVFVAVLMIGLIYAWQKGILEWDVSKHRRSTSAGGVHGG
jgi:NADH:ubiquinone oxidoreductase subunit 3 (subunit A)